MSLPAAFLRRSAEQPGKLALTWLSDDGAEEAVLTLSEVSMLQVEVGPAACTALLLAGALHSPALEPKMQVPLKHTHMQTHTHTHK